MEVLNYQEFKVTDDMFAGHDRRLENYILDVMVLYSLKILIGVVYGFLD